MTKSIITSAKAIIILIAMITFSHQAIAEKGTKTVIIKTNFYCDHCMQCESCAARIINDLSFEKGVVSTLIDDKIMSITITYKSKKTNPEKLKNAISKLGFDADEIKANEIAHSKLDNCCIKK